MFSNLLANKKLLLIITGIVGVVLLGVAVIVQKSIDGDNLLVEPTLIPDHAVPTTPPTPTVGPGDIIIDGLPLDNFYEGAAEVSPNKDTMVVETSDYRIVYLAEYETFKITILNSDIDSAQEKAESAFLEKIGLDKVNACRLKAEVYIANYVDSEYAGQTFPLSFCVDN